VIDQYGGPEVLTHREVADPVPAPGEVLLRVKAFGLNHAECYFRSGAWGEVPRITGIEAVGVVEFDPSGALAPGAGANVVGTSRSRSPHLLLDDGRLPRSGLDVVVDLVGNATLRDSLRCVRPGGRMVQLGFLGGLDPVPDFNPIEDLPTGVQLSFYGSAFVLGSASYPLAEIPFAELFDAAAKGELQPGPARTFGFTAAELTEAHRLMESGTAGGKLVVVVGPASPEHRELHLPSPTAAVVDEQADRGDGGGEG
jgi:NADPH:quinone reductase-like Zn-dependent oxidoreductase